MDARRPRPRGLRELPPQRSVRLLPAFDQYAVAASRHAERLLRREAGRSEVRDEGFFPERNWGCGRSQLGVLFGDG